MYDLTQTRSLRLATLTGAFVSAVALTACSDGRSDSAAEAEARNVAARDDVVSRATAAVPVPVTDNFIAREQVAEYMRRMDDPAKTWYVYVLSDTGAKLGYYVASSYPQSVCTFLTPPDRTWNREEDGSNTKGLVTRVAPSLDGVYRSGGGCSQTFFFDASSGAMILLDGVNTWTADAPLAVEGVTRIEVAQNPQEDDDE